MSVSGLNTFLSNSILNESINIKNEIEKHFKDTKYVIIIDLKNLSTTKLTDFAFGGRNVLEKNYFEKFFKQFIECGAKLVAFVDRNAKTDEQLDNYWITRQKENNDIFESFYAAIHNGDSLYIILDIIKGNHRLPTTLQSLKHTFKKYGQLEVATVEGDKLLAAYANELKAMAIISNDSDFMIFEGNWQLWDTKSINFDKFTTKRFNHGKFLEMLQLERSSLPILAAIRGNEVTRWCFYKIHLNRNRNKSEIFRNIARFINQHKNLICSKDYKTIATELNSPDLEQTLKNGAELYNLDGLYQLQQEDNLDEKKRIHKLKSDCAIFINQKYFSLPFLESKLSNKRSLRDIMKDVKAREFGVLSKSCGHSLVYVDKYSSWNMIQKTRFYFIYPPSEIIHKIPIIVDLGNEEKTELDNDRFKLLNWILFDRVGLIYKNTIPRAYMVGMLTILLLHKDNDITEREAKLFLYNIDSCIKGNLNETLQLPKYLSKNAIETSFLFMKTYNVIHHLLDVLGLSNYYDAAVYYDGLLYHDMSEPKNEQITEDRIESLLQEENIANLQALLTICK